MSKKKSHRKPAITEGKPEPSSPIQSEHPSQSKRRSRKYKHRKRTIFTNRSTWYLLGGAVILAILTGAVILFFRETPAPPGEQISAQEAFQKYQSGAYFLDVRNADEYQEVHIPGSILIPLGELESRLDELPREREIVIVCLSGKRSLEGRQILAAAGFNNFYCLEGGIQAWQAEGYDTERG